MILTAAHALGLIGYIAIGIALVIIGRLSARLGSVTHARPYHYGNYIAAILIWISALARLYFITIDQSNLEASNATLVYIVLIDGLPAIGITAGVIVTWYYWSWLLAERN